MTNVEMENGGAIGTGLGLGIGLGIASIGIALLARKVRQDPHLPPPGPSWCQPFGQVRSRPQSRGGIMGIRMAQHITKTPGSNVSVNVQWAAATTNAAGVLINWPYKLRAILFNPSTLQQFSNVEDSPNMTVHGPGGKVSTLTLPVPTSIPDGIYVVQVELFAARSNAQGNPDTTTPVSLHRREEPGSSVSVGIGMAQDRFGRQTVFGGRQ